MTDPDFVARAGMVVAGAAGPRGATVARALAGVGARVLLVGAREATLGEAVRAINNAGGIADYAVAPDGHRDALAAAGRVARARFGPVGAWIDAAVDDAERIDATRAAAATLLDREGGALVLVVPPALAEVAALGVGPAARVVVAAVDAAPDLVAAAVLRALRQPRMLTVVAGPSTPTRRGRLIAALGIGGVAITAGAIALVRRARRRD